MPFQYRNELEGRPFALPVAPLPGEGLSDLLLRACHENGFTKVFKIANLWGGNIQGPGVSPWVIAHSPPSPSLIARVLGCDVDAIEAISMKKTGPLIDFFGRTVRQRNLSRERRVSPTGLKRAGQQKAIWQLIPFGFDPLTLEKLLDKCPVCEKKLGWKITLGICHCEHCVDPNNSFASLTDLRDFPQPRMEVADRRGLRFLTNLIDPEVRCREIEGLHADFQAVNRGEIFELGVEIGRLIDQQNAPPEDARPHWVGEITPDSLAIAGSALMRWPTGLFEVGERLRHHWFFRRKPGGKLWHPLRQAIQNKAFGSEITVLVADVLKGSFATSLTTPGVQRTARGRVKASELIKIAKMSSAVMSQSLTTGLPVPTLVACYSSKKFVCPDPYFSSLRKNGRLLEEVFEAIPLVASNESKHLLRDVVSVFFRGKGDPWPEILCALSEGRMTATRVTSAGSFVDQIHVGEIGPWENYLSELIPSRLGEKIKLTVAEASFYAGLCERVLNQAMLCGYLGRELTLASTQTFSRRYISIKEILLKAAFSGSLLNYKSEGLGLNLAGICSLHPQIHLRHRGQVEQYYRTRTMPALDLNDERVLALCSHIRRVGVELTERHARVALYATLGWKSCEIGDRLGVSEFSVKNTLMVIYKRCGVRSRSQLANMISRHARFQSVKETPR